MNEEVQLYLEEATESMQQAIDHLINELAHIRAGKAHPKLLDGIFVDYYGSNTPLAQVANVSTPDGRTIAIQPWEKAMIVPIEKAIMAANIGLMPENNGEIVRLNIPPLTEERRKDIVKQVKNEGENAKISIRNARKSANDTFKKLQKDGLSEDLAKDAESEVQKFTDDFNKKVESLVDEKEQEVLTV